MCIVTELITSTICPMEKTQIKHLKSLAHKLKPVVTIGQHGMKESINDEIDIALNFHQLIKLKVNVGDRDIRDQLINDISHSHKAELIQRIGNIAILYKRNPKKENLLKKA